MKTAVRSVVATALAAACVAATAVSAAPADVPDVPTIGAPPTRTVVMPEVSLTGGPALGADGTLYVMRDPELHVYGPGTVTNPKVITGLNLSWHSSPSVDPVLGLAVAAQIGGAVIAVLDPGQPAGPAVLTRRIGGPNTLLEDVVAATWAPDGSLWAVDILIDGAAGVELLRFAPGADGDVAPVRVIRGAATGLDSIRGYAGLAVDSLPDGSAVVGAMGISPAVRVFGPDQDGNVAPVRSVTPAPSGTSFAQLGVAADSRGRIYVPMGDLNGQGWGEVAVYAAGATGAAAPMLRLTGPTSGLHVVAFPSLAPDDRLVVADVAIVGGQAAAVRMLEFDPLRVAPSAPRSLKVRAAKKGTRAVVSWAAPASDGGAAITRYTLKVKKGGRTLHKVSLSGTAGRYSLKTRRLPKGRLTVLLTAANAVGVGPVSTGVFRR